jgi:hypothetical protein
MILVLVVISLVLLLAGRAEWLAGGLLALATIFKIYPGLLIVYLLLRRRWMALAGFAGAMLLFLFISAMVAGWPAMWRYATEILPVQSGAVPWPENQSFNGFLSRLVVPAAATTWYTEAPFPLWAKTTFYLADLFVFSLTLGLLWLGRWNDKRRFSLAYAATFPLIILMWPIAWIHVETLLLLPFWLLALDQLQPRLRSWPFIIGLLLSFTIIAFGNEYTVLIPSLQQSWPRLLQSYKLYGVMLLWAQTLWAGRKAPSFMV